MLKFLETSDKIEASRFCYELVGITPKFKKHKLNNISLAINKELDDVTMTIKYSHIAKTKEGVKSYESFKYKLDGTPKEPVRYVYSWLVEWWQNE